jgi:hypothetical protein
MNDNGHIQPIPDSPQARFLKSPVREVGYGGQAGGGKSFGIVLDALYQIGQPGYNAILFRRTYKQLAGADGLIELSKQVYPLVGGDYLKGERIWTFKDYPGTIRFAHLEHEDDVHAYEGHQYAYIGFDELQTFTLRQYLYMFSRNRASNPDIQPYTRSTFMPGDVGHFWVKARFIDTGIEDHPRHFRRIDGLDTEVNPGDPYGVQRVFIRARLEDNPYLWQDGRGEYEKGLHQLESVDFRRKRHGDWDIRRAGRVYYAFGPGCVVSYDSLHLADASFYHAHDFGAVNEAWGLFAMLDGVYYLIHEALLPEGTTARRAVAIKQHFKGRKVVAGWGGSASEKQQRLDYQENGVAIREPHITDVESQIDKVNEMFEAGTLRVVSDCTLTIDQLENCVRDEREGIADKHIWHHLDVLRYFAGGVSTGGPPTGITIDVPIDAYTGRERRPGLWR